MSVITAFYRGAVWLLLMVSLLASKLAGQEKSIVSVEDILEFQEPREVQMSPLGNTIALVTRSAVLATMSNKEVLRLVDVNNNHVSDGITGDAIKDIHWDVSGGALWVQRIENGESSIVSVDANNGKVINVVSLVSGIEKYAISEDRTLLVVCRKVYEDASELSRHRREGYIFQYDHPSIDPFAQKSDIVAEEIEAFSIRDSKLLPRIEAKAKIPYKGFRNQVFVQGLSISPDNRYLALELVREGRPEKGGDTFDHDIVIVSLGTGECIEVMPESVRQETALCWLRDSKRLFFLSDNNPSVFDVTEKRARELGTGKVPGSKAFRGIAGNEIVVQGTSVLTDIDLDSGVAQRLEVPNASNASFSRDKSLCAFIHEKLDEPPEIFVRDIQTGNQRQLTDLNPRLKKRALGKVESYRDADGDGITTGGFLFYPVGYRQGQRYPLIVGTYGFQGKFTLTAEWHTTFPTQILCGLGYLVLLLNEPGLQSEQTTVGNPDKAQDNAGWKMMKAFDHAIDELIASGKADPARIGLYGWSHGAFMVEFILTHSERKYCAACIGEGGDYNLSGYWMSGLAFAPRIYNNLFGGPLNAGTASRYLRFSPVLNVAKQRTPLLMEFRREIGRAALEYYVPLREQEVPVELVLYEDEEHNFVRPDTRTASMKRKIDWFNFWMNDRGNPTEETEQFARWDAMRHRWLQSASVK